MKFLYILLVLLFIVAGCGKSQLELDKERIQKEADDLKRKIDSTSKYIKVEKRSMDSIKETIDSLSYKIEDTKKKLDKMDPLKQNNESTKKQKIQK